MGKVIGRRVAGDIGFRLLPLAGKIGFPQRFGENPGDKRGVSGGGEGCRQVFRQQLFPRRHFGPRLRPQRVSPFQAGEPRF